MTLKMKPMIWVVFSFVNLLAVTYCANETSVQSEKSTCGVPKVKAGFIVGGDNFSRGDFPWIVALSLIINNNTAFFCSGTIISSTFVLSGK